MIQLANPFKKAKLYRYPYGDIVQLFGENPELYQKVLDLRIKAHNGWDIFQPYGTPVLAVCDGEIADIKFTPEGYGRHIRLISDWLNGVCYEITYGHLADFEIVGVTPLQIGSRVKKGDLIGFCGNSGFVVSGGVAYWGGSNPDKKGTHLHFGIREYSQTDTGWSSFFPNGKSYFVKNYENGFCGAVDPAPFFEEEIGKQAESVIELAKRIIDQVVKFLKQRSTVK